MSSPTAGHINYNAENNTEPPKHHTKQSQQQDTWSDYMHHKNTKLRHQFHSQFSKQLPNSTLFHNIVVWVNGYTCPSRLHIRRVMGQNAGRIETYFSSLVTHVVATNLSTATRLRLTKTNKKLVNPRWITQSLKAKRLLDEAQFPIPYTTDPKQKSISSIFKPKSSSVMSIHKSNHKSNHKSKHTSKNSLFFANKVTDASPTTTNPPQHLDPSQSNQNTLQ